MGGVNERAYGIPFIFILVLGSVNLVGWNHKLPPQPIQGDNKNNNMAQLEGGAGGGGVKISTPLPAPWVFSPKNYGKQNFQIVFVQLLLKFLTKACLIQKFVIATFLFLFLSQCQLKKMKTKLSTIGHFNLK